MSDMAPDAKLVAAETQAVLKTSNAVDGGQVANRSSGTKKALFYTMLVIFALTYIVPFIIQLVTSFKTNAEVFKNVFSLPESWQFSNYVKAWGAANFALYFRNSVIVTFSAVITILAVSAPAAYVLSRMNFRGRGLLMTIFIERL